MRPTASPDPRSPIPQPLPLSLHLPFFLFLLYHGTLHCTASRQAAIHTTGHVQAADRRQKLKGLPLRARSGFGRGGAASLLHTQTYTQHVVTGHHPSVPTAATQRTSHPTQVAAEKPARATDASWRRICRPRLIREPARRINALFG